MRYISKTVEMELTLDQALQKGVEAHKAGEVQEADRYYTAIIKEQPKHPDANHNMGVLAVGIGKVQEALPFFKTALEANPSMAQFWLSYIDALIKLDRMADARAVFNQAKSKGAKGDGFDQIEQRLDLSQNPNVVDSSNAQDPPQEQLQNLINLYEQGQYQEVLNGASHFLLEFPKSVVLFNIIGATSRGLGKLDEAIEAYKKAISIKPDSADAYNNMGNTLKDQGKLGEAIEAYKKAISLKPNYAEAFNNLGVILQDQGKLVEALDACNTALSIKPKYAEAYNNMGNIFQNQNKLDQALEAYNSAISLKPDYAEAHRNLSKIKKYSVNDKQFNQVKDLLTFEKLTDKKRCHLSFALAKMYEDIGELGKSFSYLSEGNVLRKKLLNYSINEDEKLFSNLIKIQPKLSKNKLVLNEPPGKLSPIFILGMPRSGTSLVEQIISSHSKVFGAGELKYVERFGRKLLADPESINVANISEFRERYLSELSKLSDGKNFVSDKMPHNFLFIPLICAAFPEAKIIHVKRNEAATCWSSYKNYFPADGLGYCYDLGDLLTYYALYDDLMQFWNSKYGDEIYNLNYEKLTNYQEKETKKLIKHLGIDWEETCLSPQKNKRGVRTASQQQVRQKVYKGSSEAWRKYEPYLNGAFDSLKST